MLNKFLAPFFESINLAESFAIRSLLIYCSLFFAGAIASADGLAQTITQLSGFSVKAISVNNTNLK